MKGKPRRHKGTKCNIHFSILCVSVPSWFFIFLIVLYGCAIRKVETSKALYQHARQAQESGNDVEAIVYWKALVQQTDRERPVP